MADNAARNYQFLNEALPDYQAPETKSAPAKKRKVVLSPKSVPYSTFEKSLITCASIITMVLMMILVSLNISATTAQRQLQNVNTEIATQKSHNTDLEQEIGELTSTDRLTKIAKQQGLQLIEGNIRTVRK